MYFLTAREWHTHTHTRLLPTPGNRENSFKWVTRKPGFSLLTRDSYGRLRKDEVRICFFATNCIQF